MRPDAGKSNRPTASRALASFLLTAAAVLSFVVAVFSLRNWLLPPRDTWSVWTGAALVALTLAAVLLWVIGALLARRAHRERRDSVRSFLAPGEREAVAAAIRRFEKSTSGEIRVHLAARSSGTPQEDAAQVFNRVGMARTRDRNGVLFFVGVSDRRFAVIGDRGIHEVVPGDFWSGVITRVESQFATGEYASGLIGGIEMAGEALARHFPPRPGDVNELPDAISQSPDESPRGD